MIYEIFQVLLWVTAILLFISGIDDLYMDLLYWLERNKYRKNLPDTKEMFTKPEKKIAIMLGAWKEYAVIGRTLSYAVRNLKYTNYRIFVGVYPNDKETIRVVQEISKKDPRIIPCINPQNGPTTKADNLNSIYAGMIDYESIYGKFDIVIVHDAEDFVHPNSLKLYNYLIGYKGYHAIQIPVIPIKSKLGKLFHRTYCDAFAEVHTKDMIVRQAMGTFIPFSGTGMGFHRNTFNYLERFNKKEDKTSKISYKDVDPFNLETKTIKNIKRENKTDDFTFNNDEQMNAYVNGTQYKEDPFESLNSHVSGASNTIKTFTMIFFIALIGWVSFLIFESKADNDNLNDPLRFIDKYKTPNMDVQAKEITEKSKVNIIDNKLNENLPTGIIKIGESTYSDTELNIIYKKSTDGTYSVQESSFTTESAAKNRVLVMSKSGLFINQKIEIESVYNSNSNQVFRIHIKGFKSIEDAKSSILSFRNLK